MNIIYILYEFPNLTETYILNEILMVQRKGIAVNIFAFGKTNENMIQPGMGKIKNLSYMSEKNILKLLYGHLYWLIKNPVNYIYVLFFAIKPSNGIRRLFLIRLYDIIKITKCKPQHIHAHFGGKAADMAMLVNLLTGISFTFTTHAHDIFYMPPPNYRIKSRLAKKHITIANYNKKHIVKKFSVRPTDVEVIHCGFDFNFTRKSSLPSQDNKNLIMTVARLEEVKGLDILIKACSELKKQGVYFTCFIIGGGSQKKYLGQIIDELYLNDKVRLLGSKTYDEVLDLISEATVVVLPSRSEGIPNALIEAMALKIPVVGSNIGGVPELIEDGNSGFLVKPGNALQLTEKIKILLSDISLRKTFAENGFIKVRKEFNLDTEVDKLINLWKIQI